MVFVDEGGFLLIPAKRVKRTWAPHGQTPTVGYCYKHKKISAISALAVSPKRRRIALYLHFRRRSFKDLVVKRFVLHLLDEIPGPIVLLRDGGRIHRDRQVKAVIATHPACTCMSSPAMRPNSIRPNSSGARAMRPWPIAAQETWMRSCRC